jgi:hypothetical protein
MFTPKESWQGKLLTCLDEADVHRKPIESNLNGELR